MDFYVAFRDVLPSVENDPGEWPEDVAPDHAPVMSTFDLSDT